MSPERRLWLSVLLAQVSAAQGWGLGIVASRERDRVQTEAQAWLKTTDARLVADYAGVSLARLQRFVRRAERQGWAQRKPRRSA